MTQNSTLVDSRTAYIRLAVCVLLATLGSVGIWSIVVVLPAIQSELGIDRASATLPFATTMIGFAVGNIILGRYVDRVGIVRPAIATTLALGLGYIMAAFTTSVWQLALVQGLLIGVGASTGFGPLLAYISHWFKRRRGMAVALTASGNYLAGALWPILIKELVGTSGWRDTYIIIGIICLGCMLPLILMLRGPSPEIATGSETGPGQTSAHPIKARHLQGLLMFAGFACCMAMAMPQVHIVAYSFDLGFGVKRGAEMLSLMLAGGVVSRIGFGFLADRIGGLRTCILASALQCLALFAYLPVETLGALYFVSLLFGLAQGGIVPSYAIIIREYLPASGAGERVGLVLFATILGMAFGGLATGWIYDLTGNYHFGFLHGIGWNLLNLAVLSGLLWMLWGRRKKQVIPV